MNDEPEEDAGNPVQELLAAAGEAEPPSRLEDELVTALRARGLLRGPRRRRWPLAAAAVVLLAVGFGGGYAAGVARGGVVAGEGSVDGGGDRGADEAAVFPAARFVLLLYREVPAPAGEAALVAEYREWGRRLAADGRRVTGLRLEDAFRSVGAGTAADGRDLLGLFTVEASSLAEAVEIARRHPHVRHGGAIVVRPVGAT